MSLCYVLSLRVRFLAYEISQTVVLRWLNVMVSVSLFQTYKCLTCYFCLGVRGILNLWIQKLSVSDISKPF